MSDKPKFTPGPWVVHVTPWGKGWSFSVGWAELGVRHTLAKIPPINEHFIATIQEREANANLIAAGPDLYALLEWLDDKGGMGLDVHERIDAALRKARGEAP